MVNDIPKASSETRDIRLAELEGRRYQKGRLESALDHCIQTHQDTASVKAQLEEIDTEIARLETALRLPRDA